MSVVPFGFGDVVLAAFVGGLFGSVIGILGSLAAVFWITATGPPSDKWPCCPPRRGRRGRRYVSENDQEKECDCCDHPSSSLNNDPATPTGLADPSDPTEATRPTVSTGRAPASIDQAPASTNHAPASIDHALASADQAPAGVDPVEVQSAPAWLSSPTEPPTPTEAITAWVAAANAATKAASDEIEPLTSDQPSVRPSLGQSTVDQSAEKTPETSGVSLEWYAPTTASPNAPIQSGDTPSVVQPEQSANGAKYQNKPRPRNHDDRISS